MPTNAVALLILHDVGDALIGAANLNANQFLAIFRAGIIESEAKEKEK